MSYRMIHLFVDPARADEATEIAADSGTSHWWRLPGTDGTHEDLAQFVLVLHAARSQEVLDALQERLSDCEWRYIALSAETVVPAIDDEAELEELESRAAVAAREEIYEKVTGDARMSWDYLAMCALAGLIAAVGLSDGNVAVVIGAMVIAPLLAPVMAFAFGLTASHMGTLKLSLRSLCFGVLAGAAPGLAIGIASGAMPGEGIVDVSSPIGLGTMALPLAAGAAAALMAAQGKSSSLVGVMVAAALLPPLAAFGLLLGNWAWPEALRALALVALNVVGINLACQLVFLAKGVKPGQLISDTEGRPVWIGLGASAALLVVVGVAAMTIGSEGGGRLAALAN